MGVLLPGAANRSNATWSVSCTRLSAGAFRSARHDARSQDLGRVRAETENQEVVEPVAQEAVEPLPAPMTVDDAGKDVRK